MRTTMPILVATALAVGTTVVFGQKPAPTFGPEWTKEGNTYHRMMEVKVVRSENGEGANYTLSVEKGTTKRGDLLITEDAGDFPGLSVDCRERGKFKVQWDKTGQHTGHSAKFGEVTHIDLDGDGIIDLMWDNREKKNAWYISVDEKRVRVADSKGQSTPPYRARALEAGGKEPVYYLLDDGKWRLETDEDRKRRAESQRSSKKDPDK